MTKRWQSIQLWIIPLAIIFFSGGQCNAQKFQLQPAVAVEAEFFTIEKGWTVVQNGQGNYMVDIIGFQHISGERLLCIDEKDSTAVAHMDVTIPEPGSYRLWVRYEYPPHSDTRFLAEVHQAGRKVASMIMGDKSKPRYAFTDRDKPKPQWDPAWGSEGLAEEVLTVPNLKAGLARIYLKAVQQPQIPGKSASRHIDLVYLTRDMEDAWRIHYHKRNRLYPILDAFRDSVGARWEARFTNLGTKPNTFQINYPINRVPWQAREGVVAKNVAPKKHTDWIPLDMHDVAHYHMGAFQGSQPFQLEIRPVRSKIFKSGTKPRTFKSDSGNTVRVYIPPYPHWGEPLITPMEQIDNVLAHLKKSPAPGKTPTLPLSYGGWMPIGRGDTQYHRKYGQLYKAIGMRSFPSTGIAPEQMKEIGLTPNRSMAVSSYRNPPTDANIAKQKAAVQKAGTAQYIKWFDYGDEIHFSEWVGRAHKPKEIPALWREWLKKNRPGFKVADYWRDAWGAPACGLAPSAKLKPDSSADAAHEKPRLYVDSLIFYEDMAIGWVVGQVKKVKSAFGPEVLCGANYSCHPFYYPSIAMYVKWFRGGAADFGRHSEYFWQVTQAGPMINGYITEHFRAGMRFNPKAINRQYTMPHSPGNTEASFMRSCFTHLAHGAKMLDYFGIGMNETFTENHIDHRDHDRYRQIRDVNHSLGLVEDVWLKSKVVPSKVALLLSDSTERWDYAEIATARAGHAHFGPKFRKTCLAYHLERLGIWKALTFFGESPDLLIEEDLNSKMLAKYKVLYVVGDCLPPEQSKVVEQWVKNGGVLMATSGAGQFDAYRQPTDAWAKLFGIKSRKVELRSPFFRPRQELPFLKPLGTIDIDGDKMPALASHERIVTEGETLAKFDDGQPAFVRREYGKGTVYYVASFPGVAFLYSALRPPTVPDRGPNTHSVPTGFDPGAKRIILSAVYRAEIEPAVKTDANLIDTRLIQSPTGYLLPVANYEAKIGGPVTLSVRVKQMPKRVTSAYHGQLQSQMRDGRLEIVIPQLGYGDIVRIDMQ